MKLLLILSLLWACTCYAKTYDAKVVRVVDGDTVRLEVTLWPDITKTDNFRLKRINAPEPRGVERVKGLAATRYVRGILPVGKVVVVDGVIRGKYRWVSEVKIGEKNLSDLIVKAGHAEYKDY